MSITSDTLAALAKNYAASVRTLQGRDDHGAGDPHMDHIHIDLKPQPRQRFRRLRSFLKGCGAVIGTVVDALAFPLLIATLVASVSLFVFSMALAADKTACRHLAEQREPGTVKYADIWVGCMVQVDGRWVPVDNWREVTP